MNHMIDSIQHKLISLTSAQLLKVEAFIDDLELSAAAHALSEPVFTAAWNDPANDVYDEL